MTESHAQDGPSDSLDAASEGVPQVRRVVYEGAPRGGEFRAAKEEVHAIRMELARLRSRLRDLQPVESYFPHDSLALDVASALSVALIALYSLEAGERSFEHRAEQSDALWADIREHPENYVIEQGKPR